MRKTAWIVAAAVLAVASIGEAEGEGTPYLPLVEGAKWTYRVEKIATVAGFERKKDVGTATCVVKGKEKIGDEELWVLEWTVNEEESIRSRQWVRTTPTAIEVVKSSPQDQLFVVPADFEKRRARAEIAGESGKGVSVESRLGAEEEVETGAGKFKAVAVTNEAEVGAGIQAVRTVWYAKDVGIVKVAKKANVGMGIVADKVLVLTKFEKGGAQ